MIAVGIFSLLFGLLLLFGCISLAVARAVDDPLAWTTVFVTGSVFAGLGLRVLAG